MTDHPECSRMAAVADAGHKLGEFLDWLNSQGFHLAGWRRHRYCDWVAKRGGRADLAGVKGCEGGEVVDKQGTPVVMECPWCGGSGLVELDTPRLELAQVPYEQLLADYFHIDLQKVEQERRAILDGWRAE